MSKRSISNEFFFYRAMGCRHHEQQIKDSPLKQGSGNVKIRKISNKIFITNFLNIFFLVIKVLLGFLKLLQNLLKVIFPGRKKLTL